jgi:hypothetical protein
MLDKSRLSPANSVVISPEQLSAFTFSEQDGIVVTDRSQIEFLSSHANASFERCLLLPLSLQAYAASLRVHKRVRCYFDLIDFEKCKQNYQRIADRRARAWLSELGLRFDVEGIDFAEFDAPSQFLLFHLAAYLENAAIAISEKLPEIQTFHVVSSETPFPLEFYFDSDVPAAISQFALEKRGRNVHRILYANRKLVFPASAARPFTRSPSTDSMFINERDISAGGERHVGFADASVVNIQQILRELQTLNREVILFRSTWGNSLIFSGQFARQYQLSDDDGEKTMQIAEHLGTLWRSFRSRRDRSTLPECLIGNPYLDFQWEYIIKQRWLSYANMIHRAKSLTAQIPLGLLIHSEVFTAEGAILAHFYRQAGAKILVAPHSWWPCDRNWGTWKGSDSAIVFSKTASRQLRKTARISKVYVVQGTRSGGYRSLIRSNSSRADVSVKKAQVGHRKVVLVVTNALELLTVPFTNLEPHFRALAALARVPNQLRGKVLLAIKTKRGALGEDPILYSTLCGFSEESVSFANDVSLAECLEVADCAVGINVPTNAYYEVIQRNIPLIHIQTTEAVTYHPELPAHIIRTVLTEDAIWPTIGAVLFDPLHRQQLIQEQRRYLESEQGARFWFSDHSLRRVLRRLSRSRFSARHTAASIRNTALPGTQRLHMGTNGAGYVEDILLYPDGNGGVVGWAADRTTNQPAKAVHIYADETWLTAGRPEFPRPDVADALGNQGFSNAGFAIEVPEIHRHADQAIYCYAELSDGTFYKLTEA